VFLVGCSLAGTSAERPPPASSQFRADAFKPFAGPPTIPQPRWAGVTSGTSDHVCVPVGGEQDYRSGDFVGSGWTSFIEGWRKDGRSKMGWIPRDPTEGPLHVGGARAGGGKYDDDLGFAAAYSAGGDYFWPDGPNVTRAGRWTFTLTAGHESGCFVVDL
jgi:hypothetical protein